ARDLGRRQRAVEADGRKRPQVTRPVPACLRRLVLGDQERGLTFARAEDDAQPPDLYPPSRREEHVLGQAEEYRVDVRLRHRFPELLDPRHVATFSSASSIPATTSSTCGSTARSSGAA